MTVTTGLSTAATTGRGITTVHAYGPPILLSKLRWAISTSFPSSEADCGARRDVATRTTGASARSWSRKPAHNVARTSLPGSTRSLQQQRLGDAHLYPVSLVVQSTRGSPVRLRRSRHIAVKHAVRRPSSCHPTLVVSLTVLQVSTIADAVPHREQAGARRTIGLYGLAVRPYRSTVARSQPTRKSSPTYSRGWAPDAGKTLRWSMRQPGALARRSGQWRASRLRKPLRPRR